MKRNLVLVSLLLLVGASVAMAGVEYRVSTTPTFVIRTGRSEILGSVKLTVVTGTPTVASVLDFVFNGVACDNTTATGVGLVTSPALATSTIQDPINLADGCHVSVQVPGGLAVVPATDFVQIQGVRGRVDLSAAAVAPGLSITATLNVTPSGSSTISIPNTGEVAKTANGLVVDVTDGVQLYCVDPPPNPEPELIVTEGFPGAFVHHVTSLAGTLKPADFRDPDGGATNNTWIHFVVTGIPTGVTLTWPAVVAGINTSTLAVSAGSLERRSTATATEQIYEFVTTAQGTSDINVEQFAIIPTVTLPATLALGTANVRVNLNPPLIVGDATGIAPPPAANAPYATAVARPRFNDPLTPVAALLTISPCKTNLLFPWVANVAGYDTGIAIVNTSSDPFGANGALNQAGTCTLTGYPAATGTPSVAFTTASVPTGAAATLVLSDAVNNPAFNGFVGYIIAVCNFQFGHGFAYIVDNFGVGAPATAQGYVALIIPDPDVVVGGRLAKTCNVTSAFATCTPNVGEGLNQ